MNILSVTNALKEIKLEELDDEYQIMITEALSPYLPDGVSISAQTSGDEIRSIIDKQLDAATRKTILGLDIMEDHRVIVRFYNSVEKIQDSQSRAIEFDDAIKGNFIASLAFFEIVTVLILLGIYHITSPFRGTIPESKILASLDIIISNLANLQ